LGEEWRRQRRQRRSRRRQGTCKFADFTCLSHHKLPNHHYVELKFGAECGAECGSELCASPVSRNYLGWSRMWIPNVEPKFWWSVLGWSRIVRRNLGECGAEILVEPNVEPKCGAEILMEPNVEPKCGAEILVANFGFPDSPNFGSTQLRGPNNFGSTYSAPPPNTSADNLAPPQNNSAHGFGARVRRTGSAHGSAPPQNNSAHGFGARVRRTGSAHGSAPPTRIPAPLFGSAISALPKRLGPTIQEELRQVKSE
jgi:hypothetical protein